MEILQPVRFYSAIAAFEARRFLAYKNELFGQLIGRLAPVVIMVTSWSIISQSPDLDFPINEILGYFLILAGIIELTSIRNFALGASVANLIEMGKLSNDLLRPINILPVLFARHYGVTAPFKFLSALYILIGFYFTTNTNSAQLFYGLAALIVAFMMSWAMAVLVASSAFWLTKIDNLRIGLYFAINVFTGLYIPVYLMPETIQTIVYASPVVSFAYLPAAFLTGAELPYHPITHIGIGLLWVAVIGVIALFVWRRGLKSYDSVGL